MVPLRCLFYKFYSFWLILTLIIYSHFYCWKMWRKLTTVSLTSNLSLNFVPEALESSFDIFFVNKTIWYFGELKSHKGSQAPRFPQKTNCFLHLYKKKAKFQAPLENIELGSPRWRSYFGHSNRKIVFQIFHWAKMIEQSQ